MRGSNSIEVGADRCSRRPPGAPWFASPALVLLAAVAILEGYKVLNVMPDSRWQPSAAVVAALALPLTSVLTRPGRGRRRGLGQRVVMGVSAALLVVTLVEFAVHRPSTVYVLGVVDLLVALSAMAVVLTSEHRYVTHDPSEDALLGTAAPTELPRADR